MSGCLHLRRLPLATLCLVLGLCCGVHGMWFGRPGEEWMRNRVVWQRPQSQTTGHGGQDDRDEARYVDTAERGSWPTEEEEDDKRNDPSSKKSSSRIIYDLIREKGRSSTTKRGASCAVNEFRCVEDGSCIPEALLCNQESNCPMGSDEDGCKFPASGVSSQPSNRRLSHPVARNTQHDQNKFNDCLQRLFNGLRIAGPLSRSYTCPVGSSKCATLRLCFDDRYACDGYNDCHDGSDELECASSPCPAPGYIKCDNQWQCFDRTRTCDGQVDCSDGSDERNCETKECLGANQVKCGDKKQCYNQDYTCDAIIDCADGSDETNCSMYQCTTGHLKCTNSVQCYIASMKCDDVVHCVDGSDETDCHPPDQSGTNSSTATEPVWQCRHETCADGNQCYMPNLRCDGIPACADGSDEWDCATTSCPTGKVKCQDRLQCIWEEWLCDGEVQCNDGSEERGCTTYVPRLLTEAGTSEAVLQGSISAFVPTVSITTPTNPAPTPPPPATQPLDNTGNHTASIRST